jgi:predicted O-methyltransferase YrrM
MASFVHGISNILREVAQTPYYRRKPWEVLSLLQARWHLSRRKVDPYDFLEGLGIKDFVLLVKAFERREELFSGVLGAVRSAGGQQGAVSREDGFVLYCLTRWLGPECVIETGVAAGVSTTFLLAALADNARGSLWSIELPGEQVSNCRMIDGGAFAWPAHGVGWAIPHDLLIAVQGRWHLVLQDVSEALPQLLACLPRVDMFFHDDLHTPDHMLWEFECVWPRLAAGGLLVADDVNHAWIKFCKLHGYEDRAYNNVLRLGALRKR